MKRIALIAVMLFLPVFAFGQNLRFDLGFPGSAGAVSVSGSGQPFLIAQPGVQINWCSHPANALPCTNFAPTYPSISLGTPCPNNAQIVMQGSNTCVSTGDNYGNLGLWTQPNTTCVITCYDYTLTINGVSYGPYIWTAGGGSGGSFDGNAISIQGVPVNNTPPTNGQVLTFSSTLGAWVPQAGSGSSGWPTASMPVTTGQALFPTNTGQVQANFFIPATFAGNSPGTVDFTGASSQTPALNPFAYAPLQNGHFAEWIAMDESVTAPPGTVAGTPEFVFRTWFNSTGLKMPGNKNRFVGIYYSPNTGGITSSATQDSSAFAVTWDNLGAAENLRQEHAAYSDFILSGASVQFNGHAGGEVDAGNWRGSFNDGRSAAVGTPPTIFATFSAQMDRSNAGATMSTSNGRWVGYRSYVDSSGGGSLSGQQGFIGFLADTLGNGGGVTGAGVYYTGFYAAKPSALFPINQLIQIENVGTGANDYNFLSSGVNSAGTAAGFNALVGPTALGQQIHAAAGFQFDVLGSVKLKAGAGVADLCLFGSTSGSTCLIAGATAGSATFTLPTADGLNGYSLVTDGAGHLSFANITGGGGGCSGTCITTINSQTGPVLTFNTNNAGSNVALTINAAANVLTWSAAITGQIPGANLDNNAVTLCTSSTKIGCTINSPTAHQLALSLTSVWANTDLNANVVQGFNNDTNICATILAQVATLGWKTNTGCSDAGTPVPLSVVRGGNGTAGFLVNQIYVGTASNVFTATTLPNGIVQYNTTTHLFSAASALSNPMTTTGDIIYSSDNSGTAARLAGPTSPNSVSYNLCSIPSGGVATAPQWCLGGVAGRTYTGTGTDPILATDRTSWIVYTNNGSSVAASIAAMGSAGFTSNFSTRLIIQGTSPVTLTPAAGNIDGGASHTYNQGENCLISSLDNTNLTSACSPGQLTAGTGIGFVRSATGITISTANVGTPSDVTNQSTSQSSVAIATGPASGRYTVKYYANVNTPCSTGGNSVSFTFTWVDAGATRTLNTGSLSMAAGAPSTSAYLSGQFTIFVGSSNVSYISTVSGSCATGTSSYDVHAAVGP